MTKRRRAAVLGAVVAGLASLAACDKPAPFATVTVGSDSVHSEAACYNDGENIPAEEFGNCLSGKPADTISVEPGEAVRIGVDTEVAENGWYLSIGETPVMSPINETYRSFNGEAFFGDPSQGGSDQITVNIVEAGGQDSGRGVWTFQLKRG